MLSVFCWFGIEIVLILGNPETASNFQRVRIASSSTEADTETQICASCGIQGNIKMQS
jgi:hypothetical protein